MLKGGENCTNMDRNTNRWTEIPKGGHNCTDRNAKRWTKLYKCAQIYKKDGQNFGEPYIQLVQIENMI